MSRQYPNKKEFRSDSPRCSGDYVGCAIATLEDLIVRYKMNGIGTINQTTLGRSAGKRHRNADPGCRHGICPSKWCGYCQYLELKARGIGCKWSGLTVAQFRATAKAGRPMSVSVRYGYFPRVSKYSYSKTVPAKGRSDSYTGGHQVIVWGVKDVYADGRPRHYIVSDPDFGSASRPRRPPYSIISADRLEAARSALRTGSGQMYGVVVMDNRPPKLT